MLTEDNDCMHAEIWDHGPPSASQPISATAPWLPSPVRCGLGWVSKEKGARGAGLTLVWVLLIDRVNVLPTTEQGLLLHFCKFE